MPPPPAAAVVLDLDGTLVDTVGARIDAWADAFAEAGIPVTREQLEPMIGMDGKRLAREVAIAAGRTLNEEQAESLDARSGELFDLHNRDPRPLPGATELLRRLEGNGIPWAVATSSREEQIGASMRALGLDREPQIVHGSEVEHAKPAPELLILAAQRLESELERTWYVGDSTWDMRAAVSAGMPAIGVLAGAAVDGRALREAGADLVVATLAELPIGQRA